MSQENYSIAEKAFWWIRFWTAVVIAAGMLVSGIYWGTTRASLDDVAKAKQELEEKKEDKKHAEDSRKRIEGKLEKISAITDNSHDNIIKLLERQRIKPEPLPANITTGLMKDAQIGNQ